MSKLTSACWNLGIASFVCKRCVSKIFIILKLLKQSHYIPSVSVIAIKHQSRNPAIRSFFTSGLVINLQNKNKYSDYSSLSSQRTLNGIRNLFDLHSSLNCRKIHSRWLNTVLDKYAKIYPILLVPRTEHHPSSFKCGFPNNFLRQNLLHSLSRLLSPLRWNKYGQEKRLKTTFHRLLRWFNFSQSGGAGKTIQKPLKELPWNQQIYPNFCTWLLVVILLETFFSLFPHYSQGVNNVAFLSLFCSCMPIFDCIKNPFKNTKAQN